MINFQFSHLNLIAILVVWVMHIAMGLIWFQPKLFGNQWSKLTGENLNPSKKWLIPGIIGHLLMAFVLAILINLSKADNGFDGLLIGVLVWIGFIVPIEIGELVWEKIPFRLFLIRIGNHFVGLVISGYILGSW